jgi:DNA ligase (NAD+)
VIYALGIRHVGSGVAQIVAENFPALENLRRAGTEELESVPAIGPTIAESIVAFFREKHNVDILTRLRAAGLTMTGRKRAGSGALVGKTFVLTGSLPTYTREEARAMIESSGGRIAAGISKNVDYLVVGEDAGSKLTKARELGIATISEKDLLAMIGGRRA